MFFYLTIVVVAALSLSTTTKFIYFSIQNTYLTITACKIIKLTEAAGKKALT